MDALENYYILNRETCKLELHFDKADYDALSDAQKQSIKSAFLWGRRSGCWISRCKEPNLWSAEKIAKALGLADGGTTGERLSFAEQQERKAEKAEHRAERFEASADRAAARGEALQKPINDMHGDVAFFTQPNIKPGYIVQVKHFGACRVVSTGPKNITYQPGVDGVVLTAAYAEIGGIVKAEE